MSKTFIILRQCLNWWSISYSEFCKQSRDFCRLINRPPEQVNMSVDLWNRTFKHSFFDVRQELKDIALANFDSIENVQIIKSTLEVKHKNFEKGFYIFTDDDDWLHPKISSLLPDIDNSLQESGIEEDLTEMLEQCLRALIAPIYRCEKDSCYCALSLT